MHLNLHVTAFMSIILGFPPVYGGNAGISQNFLSSQMPYHAVTGGAVHTVWFNWPIKVYYAACDERKSVNGANQLVKLLLNVKDCAKPLINVVGWCKIESTQIKLLRLLI